MTTTSAIISLFVGGLLLLAIDVFVGSFVFAGLGGVALLAGVALVYGHWGTLAAIGAGVASLVALRLAVYFELVVLPRTRLGRGLVVQSTSGTPAPSAPASVVGKAAKAVTTLAPSGYVLVDGCRYEAFCQSGHVTAGSDLRVVGVDQFRLIVSPL